MVTGDGEGTPARPRLFGEPRDSAEKLSDSISPISRPDNLSDAGLVHGIGDHQSLRDHPATVSDLDLSCVHPQVRVGALQWSLPERLDLLVQPLARRRDPVLGHPLGPEPFDQPIDLPGRDPAASSTTATIACSERRLRSKQLGK